MNNLFRGIPFSQEDEIHEHIQVSLLTMKENNGKSFLCFHSFLQGLLEKISHFDGKEWPIKAGQVTEPNSTYWE